MIEMNLGGPFFTAEVQIDNSMWDKIAPYWLYNYIRNPLHLIVWRTHARIQNLFFFWGVGGSSFRPGWVQQNFTISKPINWKIEEEAGSSFKKLIPLGQMKTNTSQSNEN